METLRRTMLYLPGGNEKMVRKAQGIDVDSLIIDLEDSVAPQAKIGAREMVSAFLRNNIFGDKEVTVRINSLKTEYGKSDLNKIVGAKPAAIVVPKVESEREVLEISAQIGAIEASEGIAEGLVKLMLLIETPLGLINVEEIAMSSPRVAALLLGAGDLIRETRGLLSREGWELYYPRMKMLIAARAAHVDAIDSPYFDIKDTEACKASAELVKTLGFDGKCAIHPRQIETINSVFTPTEAEIVYAKKVMEVYREAELQGKGATQLNGQLIEHVHVSIAERTLRIAVKAGVM